MYTQSGRMLGFRLSEVGFFPYICVHNKYLCAEFVWCVCPVHYNFAHNCIYHMLVSKPFLPCDSAVLVFLASEEWLGEQIILTKGAVGGCRLVPHVCVWCVQMSILSTCHTCKLWRGPNIPH